MSYEELKHAMEKTRKLIPPGVVATKRYPLDQRTEADATGRLRALEHLKWMVAEALTWGPEQAEKLNRWLGFVQGTLWGMGCATIDEMREINWSIAKNE